MSEHVVLIGACGWLHEGWSGEFYPEDLPEEWRLGYYGNEYQVVMVPASYWSSQAGKIAEWLEESDESLKMVCEWPAQGAGAAQLDAARQGIEALAERVLAILIPIEADISESDLTIYKGLANSYPLCFDLKTSEGTVREQLTAWLAAQLAGLDYSLVWDGVPDSKPGPEAGTVKLTRISGEVEPKQLRTMFEAIIASSTDNIEQVLIVDGEPPSMKLLSNAGIILDLL